MTTIFEQSIDPLTGVKTVMGVEEGKFFIHTAEDIRPHIEHNTALRNSDDYTKQGIKNNFWHCVHVPDSALAKMLIEDGFDGYKASAAELRSFLRRNRDKYGYLFTTNGQI